MSDIYKRDYTDTINAALNAKPKPTPKPRPTIPSRINNQSPWLYLNKQPQGLVGQDADAVDGFIKSFKREP